jgi:hypothetical protein
LVLTNFMTGAKDAWQTFSTQVARENTMNKAYLEPVGFVPMRYLDGRPNNRARWFHA